MKTNMYVPYYTGHGLHQRGSGFIGRTYAGQNQQRGHGWGNIFKSVFKRILPVAKTVFKSAVSVGKRVLKSDTGKKIGKQLKRAAVETGIELATKLLEGENVVEVVKKKAKKARLDIAATLAQSLDTKEPPPPTIQKRRKKRQKNKTTIKSKRKRKQKKYPDLMDETSSNSILSQT